MADADEAVGAVLLHFAAPPATAESRPQCRSPSPGGLLAEHRDARVELVTHPENRASRRVAEKAGYARAGDIADSAEWPDGNRVGLRYVRERAPAP